MSTLVFAFLVSLAAGLSTVLGAFVPFAVKRDNTKFLCSALGLSAGVMVYISFMEMLPEASAGFESLYSARLAKLMSLGFFLLGILIIALIDHFVPEDENPHEFGSKTERNLSRTGFLSALAIAVHNFPEGIATFMSAMASPVSGVSIAFAIALHNIPEGITVSAPVLQGTGSRKKAFSIALVSGLAEPAGALIGYLFLSQFMSVSLLSAVYCVVAGIMVYLAFDELLPAAENYGHHHLVIYSLIAGMTVMGITLALL